jgi:16S rRNA (guanine527-N7)-methyltransferase
LAQDLGFLGPASVDEQVAHSQAFIGALRRGWALARADGAMATPLLRLVDLGSGGGLPALVIARMCPEVRLTLVEAQQRRASFLDEAVHRLGLAGRVSLVPDRAERVGREPSHRSGYQAATARAFGPPAVVAECAAPLLEQGGVLVVSEPPSGVLSDRWPAEGLATLGMGPARLDAEGRRFVVVPQQRPCPERFPRRVGVPAKRPLF